MAFTIHEHDNKFSSKGLSTTKLKLFTSSLGNFSLAQSLEKFLLCRLLVGARSHGDDAVQSNHDGIMN